MATQVRYSRAVALDSGPLSGQGRLDVRADSARPAPLITRGWGRTPVRAVVDNNAWQTSVWRASQSEGAVLAAPKRARGAKGHGDVVTVTFTFEWDD